MSTQNNPSTNETASEVVSLPIVTPNPATERFRYLEGQPKQYRADAKAGNFNLNAQTFPCPECGKSYPTEQQLRGHLSGHARQKKKPVEEAEPAKVLSLFEAGR